VLRQLQQMLHRVLVRTHTMKSPPGAGPVDY